MYLEIVFYFLFIHFEKNQVDLGGFFLENQQAASYHLAVKATKRRKKSIFAKI